MTSYPPRTLIDGGKVLRDCNAFGDGWMVKGQNTCGKEERLESNANLNGPHSMLLSISSFYFVSTNN